MASWTVIAALTLAFVGVPTYTGATTTMSSATMPIRENKYQEYFAYRRRRRRTGSMSSTMSTAPPQPTGTVFQLSGSVFNEWMGGTLMQCCNEIVPVPAGRGWYYRFIPKPNVVQDYKFSTWVNISCLANVMDMRNGDMVRSEDCLTDASEHNLYYNVSKLGLELAVTTTDQSLSASMELRICCPINFDFPDVHFLPMTDVPTTAPTSMPTVTTTDKVTATSTLSEQTSSIATRIGTSSEHHKDDMTVTVAVGVSGAIILIILGILVAEMRKKNTEPRKRRAHEVLEGSYETDPGPVLELHEIQEGGDMSVESSSPPKSKRIRTKNSTAVVKAEKKHRFESLDADEWCRQINAAAESGFRRLRIDHPENQRRADDIVRRIHRGACCENADSRRPCFLVQRTEGSKSQYQVQVGIVRMVVQKAIYLAYQKEPAESARQSGLIQQTCLYPDASWWCVEPTHLVRSNVIHVPPNVKKHPIPEPPHAILPVLRESKSAKQVGVKTGSGRTARSKPRKTKKISKPKEAKQIHTIVRTKNDLAPKSEPELSPSPPPFEGDFTSQLNLLRGLQASANSSDTAAYYMGVEAGLMAARDSASKNTFAEHSFATKGPPQVVPAVPLQSQLCDTQVAPPGIHQDFLDEIEFSDLSFPTPEPFFRADSSANSGDQAVPNSIDVLNGDISGDISDYSQGSPDSVAWYIESSPEYPTNVDMGVDITSLLDA